VHTVGPVILIYYDAWLTKQINSLDVGLVMTDKSIIIIIIMMLKKGG
jgi:hypothetical protein